jgi:hypothetical protein
MILSIVPEVTDKYARECPPNVKAIDFNTFNTIEIHPFIATQPWEKIEIVMGKGIRGGYIKQVLTKCNIIKIKIPKDLELDFEILSRLMEVFTTSSSELRSAFMKKQGVREILLREGVIFE